MLQAGPPNLLVAGLVGEAVGAYSKLDSNNGTLVQEEGQIGPLIVALHLWRSAAVAPECSAPAAAYVELPLLTGLRMLSGCKLQLCAFKKCHADHSQHWRPGRQIDGRRLWHALERDEMSGSIWNVIRIDGSWY